jgi:death-on-curing protein
VENTRRKIIAPLFEEVVETNRKLIFELGGRYEPPNNLLNESSLLWLLERITSPPIFGFDAYPTVIEKGALIAWTIINDHVFMDGCKRTGMVTMMTFLSINGCPLSAGNEELVDIALKIAKYYEEPKFSLNQLNDWILNKFHK